jgi:SAM-dependent methyltransferase
MRNGSHPICRSCGAKLIHTFVDLGMSPLANSYVTSAQLSRMEPFYPLHVRVCASCFLVQLPAVVSPQDLFSEYAYFSSYSDSWLEHAKAYTEAVTKRFGLNHRSWVVEIASNDGYLLQYFVARGIPALGIEPAGNVAAEARRRGIPTEVLFFGEDTASRLAAGGKRADLIIGNNVFAHVPDVNGFVSGLKLLLAPSGLITLEFPHLLQLMEQNQFDTIYHEHLSYFSLLAASHLFERHGLRVFDVEELPTHGGSLRLYISHRKDRRKTVCRRVHNLLAKERRFGLDTLERYLCFEEQVEKTKRNLLKFLIAAKSAGKSVVAYGAAAKGNTLLNYCGVQSDFIDYTVDRSPHKQRHFLPGTHIPIHHPDKVARTRPDFLLILPWNLREEVMDQMKHIRKWGGQFVVPIPSVQIYP